MAKSLVVIEVETDVKTAFEHAGWAIFNENTLRINNGGEAHGWKIISVKPIEAGATSD